VTEHRKISGVQKVKPRRIQGGTSSTDVITSCHLGDNSGIFPDILQLHVPRGSVVADITFGRGVFWKGVSPEDYLLLASDLKLGTSWDALPYADQSIDAVVFDPPYMEGLYRRTKEALAGAGTHQAFQDAYSNGDVQPPKPERKYHDAVLHGLPVRHSRSKEDTSALWKIHSQVSG